MGGDGVPPRSAIDVGGAALQATTSLTQVVVSMKAR
jgi:hypothetical protein